MTNTMAMEVVGNEQAPKVELPVAKIMARGKGFVRVTPFHNEGSASELRAALKAKGYKGTKLNDEVNAVLTGGKSRAEVMAVAWLQSQIISGKVPSCGEESKSGAVLRLVKVEESKPSKVGKTADEMTDEELEEMLAKRKAAKN